jgi:hypothetical protein
LKLTRKYSWTLGHPLPLKDLDFPHGRMNLMLCMKLGLEFKIMLLMPMLSPSAIIIMIILHLSVWDDTWPQPLDMQKRFIGIKSCL